MRLGVFLDCFYAIADLGGQAMLDMGSADGIGLMGFRRCCLGAGLAVAVIAMGFAIAVFIAASPVPFTALATLRMRIVIGLMAPRIFLFLAQERLAVGNRDLIVVRMDFRESQEAMAVAAVIDESRLQRRLDARHLGEIDVAF